MDVRELGDWLNKHKSEIPERPKWKRTILDIMGCTTLENRWSDLYKFFFDENEEHGLRDLFIRSLEEVIGEKDGWMKDFCIFREDSTKEIREYEAGEDEMQSGSIDIEKKKEKGRIDLLIEIVVGTGAWVRGCYNSNTSKAILLVANWQPVSERVMLSAPINS